MQHCEWVPDTETTLLQYVSGDITRSHTCCVVAVVRSSQEVMTLRWHELLAFMWQMLIMYSSVQAR